jgi:hypothetical protein
VRGATSIGGGWLEQREAGSRQAGGSGRVAGLVGGKLGCERHQWCSRFIGGRLGWVRGATSIGGGSREQEVGSRQAGGGSRVTGLIGSKLGVRGCSGFIGGRFSG